MKKNTQDSNIFLFRIGKQQFEIKAVKPINYYEKLQENCTAIYNHHREKYPKVSEERLIYLIFIYLAEKLTTIFEKNIEAKTENDSSNTKIDSNVNMFIKDLQAKTQSKQQEEISVISDFKNKLKKDKANNHKTKEKGRENSSKNNLDLFSWQDNSIRISEEENE